MESGSDGEEFKVLNIGLVGGFDLFEDIVGVFEVKIVAESGPGADAEVGASVGINGDSVRMDVKDVCERSSIFKRR